MLAVMMTCFVSELDTGDACSETCVDLSTCTSRLPEYVQSSILWIVVGCRVVTQGEEAGQVQWPQ